MEQIIEKNSPLPVRITRVLTTEEDYQSEVAIRVYQGERPLTADNIFLGEFLLSGIPPLPRDVAQISITFDLNVDGLLTISATETSSSKHSSLTITKETLDVDEEQVKQANTEKSGLLKLMDGVDVAICTALFAFKDHCVKIERIATEKLKSLQSSSSSDSDGKRKSGIDKKYLLRVLEMCGETINWIDFCGRDYNLHKEIKYMQRKLDVECALLFSE